jgi:hypothetical protein
MIWGFAYNTLSTNLARDLGTRIVAAIFFGGDAFNSYSPIAIFVNIPATILATAYYELLLRDSFVIIAKGHGTHAEGDEGLVRHLTKVGTIEQGYAGSAVQRDEYANGGLYRANGQKETSAV